MIVETGRGIAQIFAEAQHDAELFGLHAIEAGHQPDRDRAGHDQCYAESGEIAAGQQLLEAVLTAPQKILEIGRPWADRLRTGAPWALRTRTPRAPALILPRHKRFSSGGTLKPAPNVAGFIREVPGPYNAGITAETAMLG